MEKVLITKTGKENDCKFFAEASVGVVYFVIINSNISEVASWVSNPNETEKLTFKVTNDDGEIVTEDTKVGYTVVVSINAMPNGIRVGLRRPYIGEDV